MKARLTLVGVLIVVASLAVRVVHRGIYMPGWDFLGVAQGACLVTRGWGEVWQFLVANHRGALAATFWDVYGVPVALVPGWFSAHWPWRYWAQVVTFAEGALALLLLRSLTRGPWWVLALSVAGLGTMLSWLVAGYPYLSSWFPHVAALWVLFAARSWWASLLVGLLAVELPWHVQDLGQTVFVPFLVGAVLIQAPWRRRLLWGALGLAALWLAATAPTDSYKTLASWNWPQWNPPPLWWPELPIVPLLGLVACWRLRSNRVFWALCLGAQWALALGLLLYSCLNLGPFIGTLWPRRFLLTEFYTVGVLLAWGREDAEGRPERGPLIPAALLLAAALQLGITVRWALRPLPTFGDWLIPLPWSETSLNYHVDKALAERVVDWIARAKRGERLDLDYGYYHQPEENWTDPQAAVQQLYAAIGEAAFLRQVHLKDRAPATWGFGVFQSPENRRFSGLTLLLPLSVASPDAPWRGSTIARSSTSARRPSPRQLDTSEAEVVCRAIGAA